MRILIYNWRDLAHPNSGGAEVYTDRVATEWVKMGHEVTLFCASVANRSDDEISEGGYRVIRRGGKHSVYRAAKRFWINEGKGKFDVVIDEVNTRPFGTPKFVKETPIVALIHQVAREIWFYEYPWIVALVGRYVLEPIWLSWYKEIPVLTVSESSKESLKDYGLQNVHVVPEGSDGHVFPGRVVIKEDPPVLLFVGRLAANKRPEHAIEVYKIVKRTFPEVRMWVIGSGPLMVRLKESADPGIQIFGRISEVQKFDMLSKASLLLVTSVREGWGMVVSEAAGAGTLSIGYGVPGLRDSLTASGGVIVPEDPESMASSICQILRSGSFWVEPSPGGTCSWEEVALECERRVRSVTASSHGRASLMPELPLQNDTGSTWR